MSRLIRTSAAAAIALWATTAIGAENGTPPAQDGTAVTPPAGSAPPAATPPANGAAPPAKQGTPAVVLDVNEYEGLLGKSVRAMNGDDLGRIIDVIVDRDGHSRAAIIDFGGFLGVGSRKIAVDWRVLKFSPDGKVGEAKLMLNRNQVRVSPEYKSGEPIVVLGAPSPSTPPETDAAAAPPVATDKPVDKPQEPQPEK